MMVGEFLSGWLGHACGALNIVCTYNLAYNAALMVAAGLGSAICIDDVIPAAFADSIVFRPFAPALSSDAYLAWRKDVPLSPAANAQKYFKEYRKAQTAKKVLSEQIEKGTQDLSYLQTVQYALQNAETSGELSEIRTELSQSGFLKSKTGTKNKKNSTVPPLEFRSPDGFTVLVGRNNLQNDQLTFKKAQKTDFWFHAKKAPGSHVILLLQNAAPTDESMEFAAKLAAWFSSVRERGMAEVDYTQVKNIKKPPGAKPGYVIYHVYNTAYVKAEKPKETTV